MLCCSPGPGVEIQSGRGLPQSKTLTRDGRSFWSARVLWRFSFEPACGELSSATTDDDLLPLKTVNCGKVGILLGDSWQPQAIETRGRCRLWRCGVANGSLVRGHPAGDGLPGDRGVKFSAHRERRPRHWLCACIGWRFA